MDKHALPQSHDMPFIVLLGGGVESTHLVHEFLQNKKVVLPVYVHWGMLWEDVESEFVRRFCDAQAGENLLPLREIHTAPPAGMRGHWAVTGRDVPHAGEGPERLEIPMRNLSILQTVAREIAGLPRLVLVMGTTADNSYADGTREFFDSAERLLGDEISRPVQILTPLIEMSKSDVIRRTDRHTLAMSFSCIHPVDGLHCGRCIKCGGRRRAFREAGVDDPTSYVNVKIDTI